MSDEIPCWDAKTRGLVAMTTAQHAVTNHVGCTCGWEPDPDVAAAPDPFASRWLQWAAHNADAILGALAREGLLVPLRAADRSE